MTKLNSVDYKDCVGKVFKSNSSGLFKIVKYVSSRNIEIEFLDTGFRLSTILLSIERGSVEDKTIPSAYGVGILGNVYKSYNFVNGLRVKKLEYATWTSVLQRSYDKKFHNRNPSYSDCTVSENFKHYTYFYEWCNRQAGFGKDGWHLDKDLLFKGNKLYSEDTCIFLPPELNTLIIKCDNARGSYPVGVTAIKKRNAFSSRLSVGGFRKYLGYYKTPEEAFYAYKVAKEEFIKEQANKWKDQIDPRAYKALMNYEVEIDD